MFKLNLFVIIAIASVMPLTTAAAISNLSNREFAQDNSSSGAGCLVAL
jgi:hypothetical protein